MDAASVMNDARIRYSFGVHPGGLPQTRLTPAHLLLLLLACCGCRAWCQNAPARDIRTAKVVVIAVDGCDRSADQAAGMRLHNGFAKNEKENIGKDELAALKKLASELLAYDDKAIVRAVASGTLT